jgi:lipopolysaccharide cholinephosphotransferase
MVPTKHTFPPSFFEEEDRLGFHIDRKRKELWAIELDMLYELDRVCRKLGVSWFLEAGTLLGAARDGRFIPWDDDIDVSMLREDYDRFLREAPKEFHEPYFLQSGYTEKDYFRGHSQLRRSDTCAILPSELGQVFFNQGIFLDIFVLDELFPEKLEKQYRAYLRCWKRTMRWSNRAYHPNPLRRAVRKSRSLLFRLRYPRSEMIYRKLEGFFRSSEKSRYVDSLLFLNGPEETHLFPREWLEKTVALPFEDGSFPAPAGYRRYLAMYYGEDWETPKMQTSSHELKGQGKIILDVDRPYTEVIKERSSV